MAFFNHDGIEFHYRDEGAGRPFVFQHGLGADITQPFGLLHAIPNVRLLAFDARAHGRTHPIGDPARVGFLTFGDDLRAFLDHLKIPRAVIGGISMGAGVALNFSLRFPQRVEALILSRPAWLDAPNPWNVTMFSLITGLVREHGARRGQELFKATPAYHDLRKTYPDVANSLALQFESPLIEGTAFKLERIVTDTPNADRGQWGLIRVPTLVLANRLDPIHPFEYGEILAQAIPGAHLREITGKSISVERHNADVWRCIGEFLGNLTESTTDGHR